MSFELNVELNVDSLFDWLGDDLSADLNQLAEKALEAQGAEPDYRDGYFSVQQTDEIIDKALSDVQISTLDIVNEVHKQIVTALKTQIK